MSKPSVPDRRKLEPVFEDPDGGYVIEAGRSGGFLACHRRLRIDSKHIPFPTLEPAKDLICRSGATIRKWRAFNGESGFGRQRYITCRVKMNGQDNGRTEILDTTIDGGQGEPLIVATFFDRSEAEKFCIAVNALEGGAR